MPATVSAHAVEKSTFALDISFFDHTGAAVVPNSGLTWTLTDLRGTVINSRSAVSITAAATITIVLHGNDLALADPSNNVRVVLVQGTYNSSLGTNLELKEQATFTIDNLVAV